jgi:hypothetical protein
MLERNSNASLIKIQRERERERERNKQLLGYFGRNVLHMVYLIWHIKLIIMRRYSLHNRRGVRF